MNDVSLVIGKGLTLGSLLLAIVCSSLVPSQASAQTRPVPELGASDEPTPSLDPLDVDPDYSFLYDTRTIGLDKDGKRYLFEGDVVLIGGGNVITADKIQVDYTTTTLVAEGHVVLLHQNEVFTGTRIEMQWKTGDFTIINAVLTANDVRKVEEVSRRILGQSARELAYDAAREEQLKEIEKSKEDMKKAFGASEAKEPSPGQVTAYTRLLERERFTRESSPPMLADRDPERRRRLERRRTYWKKSRAEATSAPLPQNFYFRLEGDKLQRRDGNLYRVDRGSFTPCRCEDDETPAWGFQADEIEAQQEGYVDLHHPVLTIKGIPILYLPYLKLPLKAKRQSGFLMPSFQSGQQKNGFVYTQPVFLDLGQNADATITTDLFQKRGTRVGLEGRYEARKHSGFRFQTEMIRDTSWLQLQSERNGLLKYHLEEQPFCATAATPEERLACEKQIVDNLTPPGNTWRGKEEWQGRYFLAPRLSIVSAGKVTSDHRYIEDLYLPEDIVTAFANQANANAFSTAKARVDFDGRDFYLGLGGSLGDNAWSTERYSGQQIPAYLNLQTRLFRLLPSSWVKLPIYAEVQAKTIVIDEFDSTRNITNNIAPATPDLTLGDGQWNRMAVLLTTPLTSDSIVRVDQFTEGEVRVISHEGLPEKNSSIRSWRTGFALNLPIDGIGPLPSWIRKPEGVEGQSYVKHIMNWGLSLSMRPSVVREGQYGELQNASKTDLVYFTSDRRTIHPDEQQPRDVRDEDRMVPHQRVTLSTSHRWQVFDRVQETLPGQLPPETNENAEQLRDLQRQALRELMSVKDQPVTSTSTMFRDRPDGGVDWFINRYRISDVNTSEPVSFNISMSFDYQQEKLRQEQIKRNKDLEEQALQASDPADAAQARSQVVNYFQLPESWLGPYSSLAINWRGVSLSTTSTYNIYKNANTSLSFGLGLPTFLSTSLAMNYVVEKNAELDTALNQIFFKRIKTTNVGLSSGIIPYISLGANLIRRQVEAEKYQYGTSYQIAYDSVSGCWGLRFVREKDLNQNEENANYIVQLAVIFLGNRRNADISPGLKRQFGVDDENL